MKKANTFYLLIFSTILIFACGSSKEKPQIENEDGVLYAKYNADTSWEKIEYSDDFTKKINTGAKIGTKANLTDVVSIDSSSFCNAEFDIYTNISDVESQKARLKCDSVLASRLKKFGKNSMIIIFKPEKILINANKTITGTILDFKEPQRELKRD